ncbi:hypothetical protein AAHC03_05608 [Spirometra sp. Aus1]
MMRIYPPLQHCPLDETIYLTPEVERLALSCQRGFVGNCQATTPLRSPRHLVEIYKTPNASDGNVLLVCISGLRTAGGRCGLLLVTLPPTHRRRPPDISTFVAAAAHQGGSVAFINWPFNRHPPTPPPPFSRLPAHKPKTVSKEVVSGKETLEGEEVD